MKAQFRIEVSGSDEPANWTAAGFDSVVYLISPNPGEPLKPVEQIASGGELSRVMLALKATMEAGKKSKGRNTAYFGIRRNRYRYWRARRGGRRQEAEVAGPGEPGAVHHAPAADRVLC